MSPRNPGDFRSLIHTRNLERYFHIQTVLLETQQGQARAQRKGDNPRFLGHRCKSLVPRTPQVHCVSTGARVSNWSEHY